MRGATREKAETAHVCLQGRKNNGLAAPSSTWGRGTLKAPRFGVDPTSKIRWNGQEVPTTGHLGSPSSVGKSHAA